MEPAPTPNSSATLSGVGAAAEKLPNIQDKYWQVHCGSIEQKQYLYDYAASAGVPNTLHPQLYQDMRNDGCLTLCHVSLGIVSFGGSSRNTSLTPDQFRAMCDAYAATR